MNNRQKTSQVEILDAKAFVAQQKPLSYLVDGMLLSGFLYSLTAKTGHGKTAVALELARCVMLGEAFGGNATKRKGRVLFLIGENDIDTRMRYLAMSSRFEFEAETAPIDFVPCSFSIADHSKNIERRAREIGGYSLVIVDTSSAYFRGDDENSNTDMARHARTQRRLCKMNGHPTVITLCHPTKKPAQDDLLPRGGGAFIAEIDGNLTLWKEPTGLMRLHWQGKHRGPDFPETRFRIEAVLDPRNKSVDGDPIPTVIAVALTKGDVETHNKAGIGLEEILLQAMRTNPHASIAKLAERCGFIGSTSKPQKSKVSGLLMCLKAKGLVEQDRVGKWKLTGAGKKQTENIAAAT